MSPLVKAMDMRTADQPAAATQQDRKITMNESGVCVWSAGKLLATIPPSSKPVTSAVFQDNGVTILCTYADGSKKSFVIRKREKAIVEKPIAIKWSEFEVDSNLPAYLARTREDNTIAIRKLDDQSLVGLLAGHKDSVRSLALDSKRQMLVSTSKDTTAKIWNLDSCTLLATLKHDATVISASFNSEGTKVITLCEKGMLKIWNIDGSLITPFMYQDTRIISAKFSAKNDRILITSERGDFTFLRINGSHSMHRAASYMREPVVLAECSAMGDKIATVSVNNHIKIWKEDGSQVGDINERTIVKAIKFNKAEDKIIVVVPNGVKIYSLDGKLCSTINTCIENIESVDFLGDSVSINEPNGFSTVVFLID